MLPIHLILILINYLSLSHCEEVGSQWKQMHKQKWTNFVSKLKSKARSQLYCQCLEKRREKTQSIKGFHEILLSSFFNKLKLLFIVNSFYSMTWEDPYTHATGFQKAPTWQFLISSEENPAGINSPRTTHTFLHGI